MGLIGASDLPAAFADGGLNRLGGRDVTIDDRGCPLDDERSGGAGGGELAGTAEIDGGMGEDLVAVFGQQTDPKFNGSVGRHASGQLERELQQRAVELVTQDSGGADHRATVRTAITEPMRDRLRAYGLFSEIISWKLRFFVPADSTGPDVLARLLDTYPVARVSVRETT